MAKKVHRCELVPAYPAANRSSDVLTRDSGEARRMEAMTNPAKETSEALKIKLSVLQRSLLGRSVQQTRAEMKSLEDKTNGPRERTASSQYPKHNALTRKRDCDEGRAVWRPARERALPVGSRHVCCFLPDRIIGQRTQLSGTRRAGGLLCGLYDYDVLLHGRSHQAAARKFLPKSTEKKKRP